MNRAARIFLATGLAFVLIWAAVDLVLYEARGGPATISTGLWQAPRLAVFAIGYAAGALTFGLAVHWWQEDGSASPVPHPCLLNLPLPRSDPMEPAEPAAPPPEARAVAERLKQAATTHDTPGAEHSFLGVAGTALQLALANPAIKSFLQGIEADALARLVAAIGGLSGQASG